LNDSNSTQFNSYLTSLSTLNNIQKPNSLTDIAAFTSLEQSLKCANFCYSTNWSGIIASTNSDSDFTLLNTYFDVNYPPSAIFSAVAVGSQCPTVAQTNDCFPAI